MFGDVSRFVGTCGYELGFRGDLGAVADESAYLGIFGHL